MSSSKKPTLAFGLSLFAGIIILINAVTLGTIASFLTTFIAQKDPKGIAMASSILNVLMIPGIIIGIVVIVAAVMLYRNPAQTKLWGTIILVLSIISIIIGGGFVIGLIIGVIGGALAISWKPK